MKNKLSLLVGLVLLPLSLQAWQADQGDGTYKNPVLFSDYSVCSPTIPAQMKMVALLILIGFTTCLNSDSRPWFCANCGIKKRPSLYR